VERLTVCRNLLWQWGIEECFWASTLGRKVLTQETRPIEQTTGIMRHDLPKRTPQEEREVAAQGIAEEAIKRMDG
jgi:hypothetical protein